MATRLVFPLALLGVLVFSACAFLDRELTVSDCVDAWNYGSKDGWPLHGDVPQDARDAGSGFSDAGRMIGFLGRRAAVLEPGGDCTVLFDRGDHFIAYNTGSAGSDAPPPDIVGWYREQDIRRNKDLAKFSFRGWNACQNDDGSIVLLAEAGCDPHDPAVRPRPIEQEEETKRRETFEASMRALPRGKRAYWLGLRFKGALFSPYDVPQTRGVDTEVDYIFDERTSVGMISVLTYARPLSVTPSCFTQWPDECPLDDSRLVARVDTETGETVLIVERLGTPVPTRFRRDLLSVLRPYE